MCSVNRRPTNLKATQKPVKTEHKATSRPWGRRPSALPFWGRPKKRARAGTLGRLTPDPSPASTRNRFFHRMADANRRSYRPWRRPQIARQKPRVSRRRAWQKASSVGPAPVHPGQTAWTSPQAWISPWVIEEVWSPTYIISQETTSGISGRRRCGAQPVCRAATAKSSGVSIRRKGPSPNCWRMGVAERRDEPIGFMRQPPCRSK